MRTRLFVLALWATLALDSHAQVMVDRYGDPLPKGAIGRLGTARFRHGFFAYRIASVPQAKLLVSVGRGPGLCIWETSTGRLLRSFDEPEMVLALAVSPDGKKIFTGPELIELATGKKLHAFEAFNDRACLSAAYSPDGSTIAAGLRDIGKIALWSTETGKEILRVAAQKGDITAIAFCPTDKNVLASAGDDKVVRVWDIAAGMQRHQFDAYSKEIHALAFAPDGKVFVTASADGIIRFYDAKAGKLVRQTKPVESSLETISFSPDGKWLAGAGAGGMIRLWDAHAGDALRRWDTDTTYVASIDFVSKDTLASASHSTIRLWDIETGKEIRPFAAHIGSVAPLRFSADGKTLWSSGSDQHVHEWDLATTQMTARFFKKTLTNGVVNYWKAGDFSPDGKAYAGVRTSSITDETESRIFLWDTTTGAKIREMSGHKGSVPSLQFSASGKLLATAGEDGLRLWDPAAGRELHHLHAKRQVDALAFTQSSDVLASSGRDGFIRVWNVAAGKEKHSWNGGSVDALAMTPDGRLVAGAGNGMIRIWAADTKGDPFWQSEGIGSAVLAFSPTGRILAAAGSGGRSGWIGIIQLWETRTGQLIRRTELKQSFVAALAFSPDGRLLVSGGGDSTILVHDLAFNAQGKPTTLAAKQLVVLWDDLRADAARAEDAHWSLVLSPRQSIPFLKDCLRPAPKADAKQIARLLADLNSNSSPTRKRAQDELVQLAESAEIALGEFLKTGPTLEMRRRVDAILQKREPDVLRQLRAVAVLQEIGSPEARDVLGMLAKEATNQRVAQAAGAAR